jgi:hypothetical protein
VVLVNKPSTLLVALVSMGRRLGELTDVVLVDESSVRLMTSALGITGNSWVVEAGAWEAAICPPSVSGTGALVEERVAILDVRCRLTCTGASSGTDSPDDDPSPLGLLGSPPLLSVSSE